MYLFILADFVIPHAPSRNPFALFVCLEVVVPSCHFPLSYAMILARRALAAVRAAVAATAAAPLIFSLQVSLLQ